MNDKHTLAEKASEVGENCEGQERKNKEKSAEGAFVDFIKKTNSLVVEVTMMPFKWTASAEELGELDDNRGTGLFFGKFEGV